VGVGDRLSPTIEREAVTLTAVHDVLLWAHTTEFGLEKRRSVRWVFCPSEAERLNPVISVENPKIDGRPEFWDADNKIFDALRLWDDDRQPVLIHDDDWTNLSFIPETELES
jgi:hypothetical protein